MSYSNSLKKGKLLRATGFLFALLIASAAGILVSAMYFKQTTPVIDPATEPIISTSAKTRYEQGEINRDTAAKQIEGRLDMLAYGDYIEDWMYDEFKQEYIVTLNDGTRFAYYLN